MNCKETHTSINLIVKHEVKVIDQMSVSISNCDFQNDFNGVKYMKLSVATFIFGEKFIIIIDI